MEEDKFIHFGCWNNTNTKSKNGKEKPIGCIVSVMDTLNNYLREIEKKPNFMVIAGDNYYPDKYTKINDEGVETKVKIIYPDKMADGFNLLPNDLPIHMILGNHDLETNGKKSSLFINNDTVLENSDCAIIKIEKDIISQKPNIYYNLFYSKYLKNNTLLLMLDTSMYSDDIKKYMPCYNVFLGRNFETPQDLIDFQNTQIYETIREYSGRINNIIIIGHHPISGYKFKSESIEKGKVAPAHIELLSDIIQFNTVLKEIYKIAGGNSVNYYYLCADLHMYQEGNIELTIDDSIMNIKQYIVGTGGTKLDEIIPNDMTLPTKPGINYTMNRFEKACGFLECTIDESGIIFTPILLPQQLGGRKTKKNRKSRKTKKNRKSRKTKKNRKSRKSRKTKK
jgi:hypothetical protein